MNIFTMIKQTKDPKNKKLLNVLPPHEKATYQLYFHERVKQVHIAKFMKCTQGGISHRLRKSMKRLSYAYFIPRMTIKEKNYAKKMLGEKVYDLCMFMVETTCQSKTAELLNKKYKLKSDLRYNQVRVRHRFNRTVRILTKYLADPEITDATVKSNIKSLLTLLEYTRDNLYMLHWVALPHFKKNVRIPKKLTKEYVLNRVGNKGTCFKKKAKK